MITMESTWTKPEARIERIKGIAPVGTGESSAGGAVTKLSTGELAGGASIAAADPAPRHHARARHDNSAAGRALPTLGSALRYRRAFSRGSVKK